MLIPGVDNRAGATCGRLGGLQGSSERRDKSRDLRTGAPVSVIVPEKPAGHRDLGGGRASPRKNGHS
ncbi:hypothetical protein FOE74_02310 [Rufibacter glacialis]|uniref:Uncharacterized protein n=1 Tax=Rufibacter glacialis TaxID=1259555 RepID=A0A5M8QS77_9BACT|nr:hypothetical protein FOE74_02310 [Rufibacter glacialis]